ncbi:MAG TPA: HEAT repeat domain-containing protein [Pyrinomonadaceae bacterium]|nr:HEAT repeat domain-containing protein [Pyrinomonadaceae bacterium]
MDAGERFIEPLIAALKDPDDEASVWAAQSLGAINDKRAIRPLINVIQATLGQRANQGVRHTAAHTLLSMGEADVLLAEIKGCTDYELLLELADDLIRRKDARADDLLRSMHYVGQYWQSKINRRLGWVKMIQRDQTGEAREIIRKELRNEQKREEEDAELWRVGMWRMADSVMIAKLDKLCEAYECNDTPTYQELEPYAYYIAEWLDRRGPGLGGILNRLSPNSGKERLEKYWRHLGYYW